MHLKRIAIPKNWPIPRKGKKRFVTAGKGPLPEKFSVPLLILLRNLLGVVSTKTEAKKILQEGGIVVDGRIIKDEKFRVGLFDRIYIKKLDKVFTLEMQRKTLKVSELSKKEMDKKPAKVIGKHSLKKGRTQINLYDGKNLIVNDKDAKSIAVDDSVVIDLKENKLGKCLKFEKGAMAMIIGGKHQGGKGKINAIDSLISIKDETGKEFRVAKQNVFIIEK